MLAPAPVLDGAGVASVGLGSSSASLSLSASPSSTESPVPVADGDVDMVDDGLIEPADVVLAEVEAAVLEAADPVAVGL